MFSKKVLKPGYIVFFTATNGGGLQQGVVLLGTNNGDIIAGKGVWFPLSSYSDQELFSLDSSDYKIMNIYCPDSNMDYANFVSGEYNIDAGYKLIWKRPEEETLKQKQLRELQETIQKAKEQIEKLQNE